MFDKVVVEIPVFTVARCDGWLIKRHDAVSAGKTVSLGGELFVVASTGEVVSGSVASVSSGDGIRVTIISNKGGVRCFCEASIARVLNGSLNIGHYSQEDIENGFDLLEKKLEKLGLQCKVWKSRLLELEVYRDIITEHPHDFYQPIFTLMRIPRRKRLEYGSTTYIGKTKLVVAIYNKTAELMKHHPSSNVPSNLTRFEIRLKNDIHRHLGGDSVAYLVDNIDTASNMFRDTVKEKLFPFSTAELAGAKDLSEFPIIDKLKKAGSTQLVRDFFGLKGFLGSTRLDVTLDEIGKHYGPGANDQRRFRRHVTETVETLKRYATFCADSSGTDNSFVQMYEELKQKLLGDEPMVSTNA